MNATQNVAKYNGDYAVSFVDGVLVMKEVDVIVIDLEGEALASSEGAGFADGIGGA